MTDSSVAVTQRSDEWHRLREGRITGSRMAEAIGIFGSRRRLWRELTGREQNTYENEAMRWGTDWEPMAQAIYEVARGVEVQKVGFFIDDEYDWMGASPDGLVGTDGSVEFKCPVGAMYEVAPMHYVVQCHVVMRCAKRRWCDLQAWQPPRPKVDNPDELDDGKTRIWRVHWSDALWNECMEHVLGFRTFIELDIEPPKFKRGQKPVLSAPVEIEAPITL